MRNFLAGLLDALELMRLPASVDLSWTCARLLEDVSYETFV